MKLSVKLSFRIDEVFVQWKYICWTHYKFAARNLVCGTCNTFFCEARYNTELLHDLKQKNIAIV